MMCVVNDLRCANVAMQERNNHARRHDAFTISWTDLKSAMISLFFV